MAKVSLSDALYMTSGKKRAVHVALCMSSFSLEIAGQRISSEKGKTSCVDLRSRNDYTLE